MPSSGTPAARGCSWRPPRPMQVWMAPTRISHRRSGRKTETQHNRPRMRIGRFGAVYILIPLFGDTVATMVFILIGGLLATMLLILLGGLLVFALLLRLGRMGTIYEVGDALVQRIRGRQR